MTEAELAGLTPEEREALEERAAIREYRGGLSRRAAELLAYQEIMASRATRHNAEELKSMAHSRRYPGPGSRPSARPWWEDPVRLALYRIETMQLLIDRKLNLVLKLEEIQMAMFDDLEAKVTEVEGAAESTVVLLTEIHRELQEALAAHDPARVQAVMDRMDAMKVKLGEAVAAHPDPNP